MNIETSLYKKVLFDAGFKYIQGVRISYMNRKNIPGFNSKIF